MLLAATHPEQAAPLVLHSTTFPVELFLKVVMQLAASLLDLRQYHGGAPARWRAA